MSPKPNIPRQVGSLDIENQALWASLIGLVRLILVYAELVVFCLCYGITFSFKVGLGRDRNKWIELCALAALLRITMEKNIDTL